MFFFIILYCVRILLEIFGLGYFEILLTKSYAWTFWFCFALVFPNFINKLMITNRIFVFEKFRILTFYKIQLLIFFLCFVLKFSFLRFLYGLFKWLYYTHLEFYNTDFSFIYFFFIILCTLGLKFSTYIFLFNNFFFILPNFCLINLVVEKLY